MKSFNSFLFSIRRGEDVVQEVAGAGEEVGRSRPPQPREVGRRDGLLAAVRHSPAARPAAAAPGRRAVFRSHSAAQAGQQEPQQETGESSTCCAPV